MLLFQLGLLLVLLPVCCFAPGFFFVRKLRWNPLEKLCGSIGLSLILLYLACWAIYCASPRGNGLPVHPAPFVVVSVLCFALAAISFQDIARLVRTASVRRALDGYGFLLLWTFLLLAIIRNYSGGAWFGDWLEHFQRTLFFLRHFPADTWIFPGYVLPARPPMMNIITAFFLAQTSDRFEIFQAVFAFLNVLLFLPCYLIMRAFGRGAKRRTWLLVLLFAASPLIMQNVTYSWTKAGAAFYVVLALWFYLAGWRKRDTVRMTAAFVALAGGLLVHYSAGPYVAILTTHYLLAVFPSRPKRWHELATIGVICGLLLGTWLLWSVHVYGTHVTLASNSSVTASQKYAGSTGGKIAANLLDSLIPVAVRDPDLLSGLKEQRAAGTVRDWAFLFYQVNAIFGMGLAGGPVALWLAFRALRGKPQKQAIAPGKSGKRGKPKGRPTPLRAAMTAEQRFWLILIVAGLILGIAVVGERDPFGVAHLTMLSLQAVGLSMLAALIPWRRRTLAILVLAGCTVDFSLGVFLQARVEGLDNTAGSTVFPGMEFADGQIETVLPGPAVLSKSAWNNWFVKHQLAVYGWWLEALNRQNGNNPAFQALVPQFQKAEAKTRLDDLAHWQGWFGRHGGEVEFLGDHVAGNSGWGTNVAAVTVLALFLVLMGAVYRRTT